MNRIASRVLSRRIIASVIIAMTLGWLAAGPANAAELRFIVGELSKEGAIWHPNMVFIDSTLNLKEGLFFILENPTDKAHSFVVEGLFEEIPVKTKEVVEPGVEVEVMTYQLKPIRVIIPPKQTQRIRVNTKPFEQPYAMGHHFKFHCHLHESVHLGGVIFVAR